jgi:hypothetical protein
MQNRWVIESGSRAEIRKSRRISRIALRRLDRKGRRGVSGFVANAVTRIEKSRGFAFNSPDE